MLSGAVLKNVTNFQNTKENVFLLKCYFLWGAHHADQTPLTRMLLVPHAMHYSNESNEGPNMVTSLRIDPALPHD